jgi:S-adenosylmethionine decarboxylase proenzyme
MLAPLLVIVALVALLVMRRKKDYVGAHYIIDVDDADERLLYDNTAMIKVCDEALRRADVTIVNKAVHAFHPQGLTLLYLLTESHFSLHTWPEHRKIRIDFFSCQNHEKCEIGYNYLKHAFHGSTIRVQRLYR